MSGPNDLKTDCRQFRWDRPCAPHKTTAVTCPHCPHYDPITARLLVTKLAAVGDVLRSTAFLPAIRAVYPGAWITWVTAGNAVELFAGNPLVDEVWTPDDPRLRVQAFDVVLCPDADPGTAALASAVTARRVVGYALAADGTVRPTNPAAEAWLRMGIDDARKKANQATYQELVARVLELDPADLAEPILEPTEAQLARARGIRPASDRVVGINTGAGARWERKRWTVDHQRSLVGMLTGQGIGVLLLGGPEEAGSHAALVPASPSAGAAPVVSAGTDHDYRQFAALVAQCDVLVTGDTMALHVACARKVPVVALFGPTSLAEIELYGRGEKLAPADLPCLGCYLPTCDVRPHCQERIAPEMVRDAVLRWLT